MGFLGGENNLQDFFSCVATFTPVAVSDCREKMPSNGSKKLPWCTRKIYAIELQENLLKTACLTINGKFCQCIAENCALMWQET